jgi:hypothetical protein
VDHKAAVAEEGDVAGVESHVGVVEADGFGLLVCPSPLLQSLEGSGWHLHLHDRTAVAAEQTVLPRQVAHFTGRGLGAVAVRHLRAEVRVEMATGAGAVAVGRDRVLVDVVFWEQSVATRVACL